MASTPDTVTVTSGTTSITSLIISGITQSNIAWCIGVLAGCAAIFSAYMGWIKNKREKRESDINMERAIAERDYYKQMLRKLDDNKS